MQRATSMEDFQNSLDLSVGASASYGLFNASAKFNYSESQKFHSFSDYVIVRVVVENPLYMIHGIKPTRPAEDLVRNGQTEQFQQQFGNTFVLGIKTGGAYYAVLEFVTQSKEEQRRVGAALSFSYLTFSGSAEFSTSLQSTVSGTKTQISSFQMGGSGTGSKVSVTVEDIINKATNFPNEVKDAGVPIKAFIQDYTTLDFPNPPNPLDLENRALVLTQFYRLRNTYVNKLNDIRYITQEHPEQFEDVDSYNLPVWQEKIQGWLDSITESASKCANVIHECKFVTPTADIISLPPRKAVTTPPPPPPSPLLNVVFNTRPGVGGNEAQEWINELANVYADMIIQDVRVDGNKVSFKAGFSGSENVPPEMKARIEEMLIGSGATNVSVI
jgi:hypothetical protein